jgi:hypothetical protein
VGELPSGMRVGVFLEPAFRSFANDLRRSDRAMKPSAPRGSRGLLEDERHSELGAEGNGTTEYGVFSGAAFGIVRRPRGTLRGRSPATPICR